jgi:glutathione S-transferase
MAQRLGEIEPYPNLQAYLDRNMARPAWKQAMEKTGG